MSSTFMPWAAGLKSWIAILAAVTAPGPLMSAYRLDMSFITPSLTLMSSAWAAVPNKAAAAKARLAASLITYLPRVKTHYFREPRCSQNRSRRFWLQPERTRAFRLLASLFVAHDRIDHIAPPA